MAKKKVPSFFKKLDKVVAKLDDVTDSATFPEFFFDSGSCIINKIISDQYDGGYAQGRTVMVAGPSDSGKSFLIGNAVRQALKDGYAVFVVDSENALDDVYMGKIGIDVDDPYYNYKGVSTLTSAKKLVSEFFKNYKEAPESERVPVLMVTDSLDMLRTDTQIDKDSKGTIHNDMGQAIKQLNDYQTYIMHTIKTLPICAIFTKQPYDNQDLRTTKHNRYVITKKLRYPHSQIVLVTNNPLKDEATKEFHGINMNIYGFKGRFAKPFQQCNIEVPYEEGIDWYSGMIEAAVDAGVVIRGGSWYTYKDTKFQKKGLADDVRELIFTDLVAADKALRYVDPDEANPQESDKK